jgi:hypothetical protein
VADDARAEGLVETPKPGVSGSREWRGRDGGIRTRCRRWGLIPHPVETPLPMWAMSRHPNHWRSRAAKNGMAIAYSRSTLS